MISKYRTRTARENILKLTGEGNGFKDFFITDLTPTLILWFPDLNCVPFEEPPQGNPRNALSLGDWSYLSLIAVNPWLKGQRTPRRVGAAKTLRNCRRPCLYWRDLGKVETDSSFGCCVEIHQFQATLPQLHAKGNSCFPSQWKGEFCAVLLSSWGNVYNSSAAWSAWKCDRTTNCVVVYVGHMTFDWLTPVPWVGE